MSNIVGMPTKVEAESAKNIRIYGIDPGGRNVESIGKATEWELFLEYYAVTYTAWRMNHDGSRDHSRGYVSDERWESIKETLAEMQYDIEYLIYTISKKIGIGISEPEAGKHISPDETMFMEWYVFYSNHFMHALSDEQWGAFEAKRKNGEDVSEYLPAGDWRETA